MTTASALTAVSARGTAVNRPAASFRGDQCRAIRKEDNQQQDNSDKNDWLQAGIIEKGEAEWTHPIVLVRKKSISDNPTDRPKYRVCLDLRSINKAIKIASFPMPTFSEIVETFGDPLQPISRVLIVFKVFYKSLWTRTYPGFWDSNLIQNLTARRDSRLV